LLAARTPPADTARPFVLHVPIGLRARTELAAVQLALPPTRRYVTRHGETLAEVAARYGLDVPRLLALSGLASEQRVVAGTEILVPDRAPAEPPVVERPLVAVEEPPGGAPPGRRRVFYRVVPGDELSSVARALGVRREDLVAWNALDEEARLQSGMWLQAYLAGEPPAARVWDASQVDVLRRGSEEFHARVVAHDGRVRIRVTVGEGDTMERVAARYGLTVGSLARINHRSRHAALHPGEELIVYTTPERLPPAPTAGDARDAHDAAGEARAAGEGDVTPAQSAAAGQTASP
jgi:membrane-bound lytic murein transglycosylase D